MRGAREFLKAWARRVDRLAVAVTAAVVMACLLGAYLFTRHHSQELVHSSQQTAQRQAELIRLALEHQMQENKRALIGEMVHAFSQDPSIHQVRILDRRGRTRFSGGQEGEDEKAFAPTCMPCHESGAGRTLDAASVAEAGPQVMRVVVPIKNDPVCYECHEPEQTVNGALLVDVRMDAIQGQLQKDTLWLAVVIGAIAAGLLGAIALIMRTLVVRRLEEFQDAARAIAAGQLDRRLPARGHDALSWMARAFNAVAESVMRLAGELRGQRELLEMVINSVDDGIAVLDKSYRFVAANDSFLARAGKTRADVTNVRCQQLMGAACPNGGCPVQGCFEADGYHRAVVNRIALDGQPRVEELHASPIRHAGEVIAVVEVWRDITERRAAEARMAESHRLASLGMLASGFSHELNTPLATILTCLDGILRILNQPENAGDARAAQLLERAQLGREQILRCRGVTQQFLRLSRGQAAPLDLVDLGPVVEKVVRLVEPTARDGGVEVVCGQMREGTAVVRASDAEVQQVLLNLLLNAIQACDAGGRIQVDVVDGPPVRIRVRDNGHGIPSDQLQKIFEPFYGLRRGGTGLGLFLSLSMARGWGADIQVQSAPGQGATFEVAFDRRTRAQAAEA